VTDVVVVKGASRGLFIPACSLTVDDLRRLYSILSEKAREATERQIQLLRQVPGQSDEEFAAFKDEVRASLRLSVQVQDETGEWIGGVVPDVLNEESLPDSIESIVYDSAFLFRARFGQEPDASFQVKLDFSRVDVLDLTNPSGSPTPNDSTAVFRGQVITWVNGVHSQVESFFRDRATPFSWLHSHYVYDLLLVLVGFPASLAWVYRIDQWLTPFSGRAPQALFVAFYVYVVLVSLYMFRLTFNYARRIFPRLELRRVERRGAWRQRAQLAGLVGGLLSSALYELAKRLLGP
jgi:hypothetical protein